MTARRVKRLPGEVANRIAAGEVVERPASVVKELVENSIDARATTVRVRIEGAGRRLIAVEDDGEGMVREDAILALERHATSKITRAEDLEEVATLGFRGEALPSVASVSRLTLTTRVAEEQAATRLRVEGGTILSVDEAGAPVGTSVEVRDVFFNTPARLKFLKSDATELRNVVEQVTLLALVHSRVGFELRSGDRLLLAVPRGLGPEERAAELVGPEVPGGLHWSRFDSGDRRLTLAFGAPHEARSNRKGVRLFVNGRPVQDRILHGALLSAFRGYLESGRTPRALLWIEVPAQEVDVNVHPAKREVRFRDEGRVFRWVAGCVDEALARAPWVRGGVIGRGTEREGEEATGAPSAESGVGSGPGEVGGRGGGRPAAAFRERVAEALEAYGARAGKESRPPAGAWGRARPLPLRWERDVPEPPRGDGSERQEPAGPLVFGGLRFLGVFDATYLLFEDADNRELVILDQHAAHERILYEALLARRQGEGGSQPLLVPRVLECTAAEVSAFAEREAELRELGFRVEPFGSQSLALLEAPGQTPPHLAEAMLRDLLAADGPDEEDGPDRRIESRAARAACAGAVKAGRVLLASEVEELLRRLAGLRNPASCPHGRPLLLRIGRPEMERMFHRR